MAQTDKILEYMKEYKEITQREAIYLGCYRLAAVIFILKKQGYNIKTEMRTVEKTDGTTTRIAAYSLEEGGEERDGQGVVGVHDNGGARFQEEQPKDNL